MELLEFGGAGHQVMRVAGFAGVRPQGASQQRDVAGLSGRLLAAAQSGNQPRGYPRLEDRERLGEIARLFDGDAQGMLLLGIAAVGTVQNADPGQFLGVLALQRIQQAGWVGRLVGQCGKPFPNEPDLPVQPTAAQLQRGLAAQLALPPLEFALERGQGGMVPDQLADLQQVYLRVAQSPDSAQLPLGRPPGGANRGGAYQRGGQIEHRQQPPGLGAEVVDGRLVGAVPAPAEGLALVCKAVAQRSGEKAGGLGKWRGSPGGSMAGQGLHGVGLGSGRRAATDLIRPLAGLGEREGDRERLKPGQGTPRSPCIPACA